MFFFIVLVSSIFLVFFILSAFSYPILDVFINIFDAVFGFAICVILIAFFVGFILNQQKKYRENKDKIMQVDINSAYNTSSNNQSQSDSYKNNSENDGALRRYDDVGCYGTNPATGLPLRSSGTDVAGNPLGPSNISSSADLFSQSNTITHNNDTNL